MTTQNIVGVVIVGALSFLMIVMAIALLKGRGAWMIAGYNTMSKEEQEQFDRVALCKFMGKILLPIGLAMPMMLVGMLLGTSWFFWAFTVLTIGLAIFAVVYANTGNRFRK